MKKVLLAALAVGFLSVSAFAIDGKIGVIRTDAPGDRIIVEVVDANGVRVGNAVLEGTPDQIKAALAVVLTAKSTNADVTLSTAGGVGGTWTNISLK